MREIENSTTAGAWILQDQDDEASGAIIGVCQTIEEVEGLAQELADLFPNSAFAFFQFGYRFGGSARRD